MDREQLAQYVKVLRFYAEALAEMIRKVEERLAEHDGER